MLRTSIIIVATFDAMNTSIIIVENIKCGGCANTITSKLIEFPSIINVQVDKDTETVTIMHDDAFQRHLVVDQLLHMGYPENGNNNLLHKAKSYVSCAIGKMS